ncbi:ATP-grasp domain-containing protein [Kibdelosporangium philippinense]|uniref:ATP-grasp domain-containing protein n=1 Tax=Kibdelosporangium philippinense TaxID=211113 RepID=A0ABS8ZK36_9PSEU|nr:ATP-grasp domain-containing protein [Kibdelosporangium philippinense]MCE7008164.1 ATP-grasp domain-containing protein [Kibdelosporangium philippinense]
MTAPLADYPQFAGKRLAIVEHMLNHPFYLGLRQAQERGLEVWLLTGDRSWYTHGHDWDAHPLACVDKVFDVDTNDPEAVLAVVTDENGKSLVDGLTSFSDYHTVLAAQVARRLGLPGPNPEAIETANVKDRLRVALGDKPFNIPHFLVQSRDQLDEAAELLGFPMIAKPPAEAISYGVVRVDDMAQLVKAWEELSAVRHSLRGQPRSGDVLLEQYVEGVEVSVETMTVDGHTHVFGVTSKDLFGDPAYIECGHTFPVPLSDESRAELYHAVRRTLELIGYDRGPCHTEARDTKDGWRIIEANPRTPSSCMTMLVTDVTGRSPILDAWVLALGGTPQIEPVTHSGGAAVRMIYPTRRGVLKRVDGIESAQAVPGVEVLLHVEPGDKLLQRMDNSSCVGFTYCKGPDRLTAQKAADEAAACLDFVVEEDEL